MTQLIRPGLTSVTCSRRFEHTAFRLEVRDRYDASFENESLRRFLTRDQAQAAGLPEHDYWLFDSRTLVKMHFDGTDRFLGGELIEDPAVFVQHNYWRDAAWHKALRRDDFAAACLT